MGIDTSICLLSSKENEQLWFKSNLIWVLLETKSSCYFYLYLYFTLHWLFEVTMQYFNLNLPEEASNTLMWINKFVFLTLGISCICCVWMCLFWVFFPPHLQRLSKRTFWSFKCIKQISLCFFFSFPPYPQIPRSYCTLECGISQEWHDNVFDWYYDRNVSVCSRWLNSSQLLMGKPLHKPTWENTQYIATSCSCVTWEFNCVFCQMAFSGLFPS